MFALNPNQAPLLTFFLLIPSLPATVAALQIQFLYASLASAGGSQRNGGGGAGAAAASWRAALAALKADYEKNYKYTGKV